MARDAGNQRKQDGHTNPDSMEGRRDAAADAVGDNRRAGDLDGNKTGGDSKSPGATEATDDESAGSTRPKRVPGKA